MSFTITETKRIKTIGGTIITGIYTNTSGSTGGDISHGLAYAYNCRLQPKGSSVATSFPVVNETFPVTSAITIVTTANEVGTYEIIGI